MIEGKWTTDDVVRADTKGAFLRKPTVFHDWVTADGAPGPAGGGGFKAEAGRYHLYVSLACPWAHRTVIMRALKHLEGAVSMSVVDPEMRDDGWEFSGDRGCVPDTVNGAAYLHEIYAKADPAYTGRVSVPVLWDRERGTIVNNESSEIIRMFDLEFSGLGGDAPVFYPEPLRDAIDEVNAWVYETVNNGVYRCGFAGTQEAYEDAFDKLFASLDRAEEMLETRRYLAGARLTEADIRLFTTLVRFDAVYHNHFRCNLRKIAEYPNLSNYTREIFQIPGVGETVDLDHIKRHYYTSHRSLNPSGFVPKGPAIDFSAPHDRARLSAEPL